MGLAVLTPWVGWAAPPDAGWADAGPSTVPVMDGVASLRAAWRARALGTQEAARLAGQIEAHAQSAPKDAAAWVWLAMARYWEGLQLQDAGLSQEATTAAFDAGVAAARTAQGLAPKLAGGWFWDAVNAAKAAEMRGIARSVSLLPHLKSCMNRVDALEPGYFYGGTGRFRGAVIARTPSMLVALQGASLADAEDHYKEAQRFAPHFLGTRRFLAELRFKQGRRGDALAILQGISEAGLGDDPDARGWNLHEQGMARRLLTQQGR